MASKVNTKFVVILSLSMFAGVAAVGGTLYWVKKNDASRLIRKGDEALAAGDLKSAERSYAKAVNKRQTDGPLLKKWGEVLQLITPDTQTEYSERYREYVTMRRSYAIMQQTDVAAHRDYLDVVYKETVFSPYSREGYDGLIESTNRALSFFGKGTPAVNGNPDTLRRYRGIARATIIAQLSDQVEPRAAAEAIEDLEAAVKADPSDEQALNSIVLVQASKSSTARKNKLDLEASEAIVAARDAISAFLTSRPDSPSVQLSALELDLDEATRAAMLGKVGAAALAAAKEKRASFAPRLDPILESMKKVGPGKLEPNTVMRFMIAEAIVDPASKRARCEALLRDIITRQPDDFFALQFMADLQGEHGNVDEAIATLQKIIDLPKRKLSVEGVLLQQVQPAVVGKQARFAMLGWEKSEPANRPAALQKAKDLTAKFRVVAGEVPAATLLDAQMKFAEGDLSSAQKLLQNYNNTTRENDADGLWLQAQVMIRNNSAGATEKLIEKVVKLQPGNLQAHLSLAEIKVRFQKFDEALGLCERVLEVDPGNKVAQNIVQGIKVGTGSEIVTTGDPVTQAVADASRLSQLEKNTEAIDLLRKALVANKYDTRIALFLVSQLSFTGDKAGALAAIEDTFKNNPAAQKSQLGVWKIGLESKDPVQAELAMIEAIEPKPKPLDYHILRHQAYKKANMTVEAAAELKEAAKIDPDDVKVIELSFLQELEAKNFAECLKYVEKAEKRDIDRTGGRTFRARYLFAQGQYADAISLMEVAAKEFSLTADTWRVLARMQAQAGRGNDAIASYAKALELRPDDISLINENIMLLQNTNRGEEALAFARSNFKFGQNNSGFTAIYLDLEGRFGDKAKALDSRKKILVRNPGDRANRMAIAWLELDLKQFDDARKLIDELRKEDPSSVESLVLDARFSADRGDFTGARNLFAQYINNISRDKLTADPYISFARMMFQYDQNDAGFNALEQGRRYQDPKLLESDRMLADRATQLRRTEVAEAALRRIVEAKADTPEQAFTRRLIENLNSQKNYSEAQTFLATLTTPPEKDIVIMLLAADAARGLNDEKKSQDLLDRAKSLFPNDPRVWVKSAQNNMRRPELAGDAEADLNRAIQIDPRNPQLYEIRGGFYINQNKITEGITDLQKAVGLNPGLASLRLSLMRELIHRDRPAEALTLGEDALKSRGNDVQLSLDMADVFMEGRQGSYAARFYKQAWELNKTLPLTQRYLDCLLNSDPPLLSDAERVLKDRGAEVDRSPELRQARAKLHWRRGRMDEARRDMRAALDLISPEHSNGIFFWYSDFNRIYPKGPERAQQLNQFAKDTTAGSLRDWLTILQAMSLGDDSAGRGQSIKLFGDVLARAKSDTVKLAAYQQLAISYYLNNQFVESTDTLKAGIEKFPEDWELNNNMAFTLATSLNRAKDALPYAEKTLAIRPDNIDSLDTLGTVYLNMNELDKAEEVLRRASLTAGRLNGQASAMMHLTKTLILKKKFDDAKKVIVDLDNIGKSLPTGFPEQQKKELDALRAEADSPQNK